MIWYVENGGEGQETITYPVCPLNALTEWHSYFLQSTFIPNRSYVFGKHLMNEDNVLLIQDYVLC